MTQTVYDVGDPITSRLKLGVTPDGTSTPTVTVTRPDGTAITGLTPSGSWGGTAGDERTVQFFATDDGTSGGTIDAADGDWLAVWKVTGTGASVSPKVYNVAPLPGTSTRVPWSPFLSDVADHVPFLTIDQTAPGSQFYLGTFTGNTSPTDEQAQRHVDAAASIVGAGFGTLTGALPRMARAVAALWAAGTLCRAFARDADTRALADALSKQAAADLKVLQTAVDNAGADSLSALPVLVAPRPVPWGDDLEIGRHAGQLRWVIWPE
jgi:hypothetical protein